MIEKLRCRLRRVALLAMTLAAVAWAGLACVALASGGAIGGPQTSAIDDGGGGGGGDDGGGGGGGGNPPRHRTSAVLSCLPVELDPGAHTTCTATVSDTTTPPTDLGGKVTFSSEDPADVFNPGTCDLQKVEAEFKCSVDYAPVAVGAHVLAVAYEGDTGHLDSASEPIEVTVTAPPGGGAGGGGGGAGGGGNPGPSSPPVTPPPVNPPQPPPVKSRPAPNTMLVRQPPRKSANRRAKFALASDQGGSRFECKLDGKPFKACAALFQASVSRGRHTLRVRAVNARGVADPTPAVVRWQVL